MDDMDNNKKNPIFFYIRNISHLTFSLLHCLDKHHENDWSYTLIIKILSFGIKWLFF